MSSRAATTRQSGNGATKLLARTCRRRGIAFHWLWIGAVYALALGAPVVAAAVFAWLLVRALRRRREDALLSRS